MDPQLMSQSSRRTLNVCNEKDKVPIETCDEFIEPKAITHNYNYKEQLQFKLQAQKSIVQISKNEDSKVNAMITLLANEQKEFVKNEKVGVDLICVIDKSGSMEGNKIRAVKNTLSKLLEFLTAQDRLCLVSFDSQGHKLSSLMVVNEDNKPKFQQVIQSLKIGGGTKIYKGMKIAVNELENRKYINNVAAIFLLSDGQDNQAKKEVQHLLDHKTKHTYTIHSFGYGQDHDPDMMTAICQMRKGCFYFIDNVEILDECFVSALGALQTVIAENILIKLTSQLLPHPLNTQLKITQTFGEHWIVKEQQQEYCVELFHLVQGLQKNFVFEFSIPQLQEQIGDDQRQLICFKAEVTLVNGADVYHTKAVLPITFYNQEEALPEIVEDQEVLAEYYRIAASKVIDDAMKACIEGEHIKAQEQIQVLLNKIRKCNANASNSCQKTIFQLEQSIQACSKVNFQTIGHSQLHSFKVQSSNQFGLTSYYDKDGQQQVAHHYSHTNKTQTQMGSKVRDDKQQIEEQFKQPQQQQVLEQAEQHSLASQEKNSKLDLIAEEPDEPQ